MELPKHYTVSQVKTALKSKIKDLIIRQDIANRVYNESAKVRYEGPVFFGLYRRVVPNVHAAGPAGRDLSMAAHQLAPIQESLQQTKVELEALSRYPEDSKLKLTVSDTIELVKWGL
jgi:hypothetical protein